MIVGHRGSGKTSLLERWKSYCPQLSFADLDREIENFEGLSVTQIFSSKGEAYFRNLENQVWDSLKSFDVIAVGGGFDLEKIQGDRQILWIRRDSDSADRIFLDRPVLSNYPQRFQEREKKFQDKADFIYTIPEGLQIPDEEEKKILMKQFSGLSGAVTQPRYLYPDTLIETRDDLPDVHYSTSRLLYSVRQGETYPAGVRVDWDIKKPLPSDLKPYIVSTHENNGQVLEPYEKEGWLLKFSPLIETWGELEEGYKWQQVNSDQRIFLPRSSRGRWTWFRLWMKGRQALNFWREGKGSALDQPTLWEWMSHPDKASNFAAVLGSPIQQSYSPVYHKSFFRPHGIPFYRIEIQEREWSEAFSFLDQLGLIAAAVTAPLKFQAGHTVGQAALNTLRKHHQQWQGISTDSQGAQVLLKDFMNHSLVVWGGGGVLEALKKILPKASSYYSAQEAQPRENSFAVEAPQVVLWGDPHDSLDRVPSSWKPKAVIDLSYHDRSPARVYAQKVSARYLSGLPMFIEQARHQQIFWKEILQS